MERNDEDDFQQAQLLQSHALYLRMQSATHAVLAASNITKSWCLPMRWVYIICLQHPTLTVQLPT
jgi:hypothetical protein